MGGPRHHRLVGLVRPLVEPLGRGDRPRAQEAGRPARHPAEPAVDRAARTADPARRRRTTTTRHRHGRISTAPQQDSIADIVRGKLRGIRPPDPVRATDTPAAKPDCLTRSQPRSAWRRSPPSAVPDREEIRYRDIVGARTRPERKAALPGNHRGSPAAPEGHRERDPPVRESHRGNHHDQDRLPTPRSRCRRSPRSPSCPAASSTRCCRCWTSPCPPTAPKARSTSRRSTTPSSRRSVRSKASWD